MRRRGLIAVVIAFALPAQAHASPGDIDPTFGHHGVALLSLGHPYAQGSAIAIDSEGRIVVAGTVGTDVDNATEVAIARLTAHGKPDRSFSADGVVTIPVAGPVEVDGLAIDLQDRPVLGATVGSELLAIRVTARGEPDSTFAGDGLARAPAGGAATGGDVALVGGGSVVVGATGCTPVGSCHFVVARFTAAGQPDATFAHTGVTTTDFPSGNAALTSIAVAPDGALVAGGKTDAGGYFGGDETALARYLPDGGLDQAFGGAGRAVISEGTAGAEAIAVDSQNRLTELGGSGSLLRLLPDLTFDPTFAGGGSVYTGPQSGDFVTDSAGRIVIAGAAGGCSRYCSPLSTIVQRVLPEGVVDRGFGQRSGFAILSLGSKPDSARGVAVDSLDRPVLVGFSGDRMVVARLEVATGRHDIDGDGLTDKDDLCPAVYSKARAGRQPGCPVVTPKLTLRRRVNADLWIGSATSPQDRCAPKQAIQIYRERPGADQPLGEATYAAGGSFTADGNLTPGTYYAAAVRFFKVTIGLCRASRSNEVVIDG
jgi:uncharacterized delta-60 repeat protein